uniref:Uncharacterized protein n=1 Tax=Caenorhabditis tropicalis TaxID=1561998 RepID=A0A1I7TUB8_9PELO
MNWITVAVAFAVLDLSLCGHNIHPHFMEWMKKNYKPEEVKQFVRDELITGSFGGGPLKKETHDRPVVFVHGLNNEAGSFWKIARDFDAAGFPPQYLFATTWGRGVEQMNLNVAMACGHIRRWIELVLKYTGANQIDVIGYSMGSPIARKAILGGKCVDEPSVELGPSLQSRIHTYISVAGANQGSHLCMFPFFDICNMKTGLTCNSKFLEDINWFKNYESTYKSFNLASTGDFVVGYMACGKKSSEFAGGHEYKVDGMNHEQTEFDTAAIQLNMLRESTAGLSKSRPSAKSAEEKKKKNAFADVKKYLNSKRRDTRHTEPKKAAVLKSAPAKKDVAPKKPIQKRAPKASPKAAPKATPKAAPKKSPAPKKTDPKKAAPQKKDLKKDVKQPARG